MKICLIILLLLLESLISKSQMIYFNEEYNNDLNSGATGIFETDSGYIIGGWSELEENGIGLMKVLISTIASDGNQISWKTYGEWGWQYSVSQQGAFTKISDGGYTLCGTIMNYDISAGFMMKFDHNGDSLWIQTYYDGAPPQDTLYSPLVCRELPDKGFILAGQVSNDPGGDNILLMRTDSLGNKLWLKQYDDDGLTDAAVSIALLPDGGFLLGTVRMSPLDNYLADAGLLKTDSFGNVVWMKYYGGQYEDWASVVTLADDGNYLVGSTYAVYEYYPGYPEQRAWIFKTDTAGNVLWDRTYARCNFLGFCTSVKELDDGNIVISGQASYTDGFGTFGYILKTNSVGDSLWMHDYSLYPEDENFLNDLSLTSDNGIILTGCTFGPPSHVPSVWAEKLDSWGQIVGINEQGSGESGEHGGIKLWPNPACEMLNVECLMLNEKTENQLVVYDFFGKEIMPVSFTSPLALNISSLPQGIYLAVVKEQKRFIGSRSFVISR
jgi:hypothetical protein